MAISMACLASGMLTANAQSPVQKPNTPWTPYTETQPTTQSPAGKTVSNGSMTAPPGVVPKTVQFQKSDPVPAVPAVRVLSVPAVPTTTSRSNSNKQSYTIEVPPIEIERSPVSTQNKPEQGPNVVVPRVLPNKDDVFRLDNDQTLHEQIQRELGNQKDLFPKAGSLIDPGTQYVPKTVNYPAMQAKLEPTYVIHRRLYFEDKNAERGGWDLGAIQPFVSAGWFARDLLQLPHNVASGVWKNRWDTSAGKCLPGDPTPYYLYPRGYTVSGLMMQSTVLVGLPFIFP